MKKILMTSALLALVPAIASAEYKNEHDYDASVAAGFNLYDGNTEKLDYNLDGRIDHTYGRWGNVIEANAVNTSQDDIRSGEKYRFAWQPRYQLSERDYVFGEAEYVKDRYSGYDYRMSELLGYGRTLLDGDSVILGGDSLYWTGEAALGMRQAETDAGVKEDDFIQRLGTRFEWDINERVTFVEDASYTFGEAFDEATSKTNLKVKMSDKLFISLGHDLTWLSEVPLGTEDMDSHTYAQVGYDF